MADAFSYNAEALGYPTVSNLKRCLIPFKAGIYVKTPYIYVVVGGAKVELVALLVNEFKFDEKVTSYCV